MQLFLVNSVVNKQQDKIYTQYHREHIIRFIENQNLDYLFYSDLMIMLGFAIKNMLNC
ncbi:hypothetical protein NIES4071_01210 [Calothrix sp. NIES-4071]|nr:hypothetical protein NIES4071_01210 [Calothrix sp. NIES-4071]BAZ54467.1 hypothetical protein NIES4105_01200 [Calothrix sp. NIES-4105]